MTVGLSFKKQDGSDAATLAEIKNIVYEDNTGNKYTLNFSNAAAPKLKYLPKGGTEGSDDMDFSSLTGLLTSISGIKTTIDKLDPASTDDGTLGKALTELKTEAGKIAGIDAKVGEIKTTTNKLDPASTDDGTLGKALTELKDATTKITGVDTKVSAIKTKTDKMPDNLETELTKLATMRNLINSINLDDASKTALQNNFNNAIKNAITSPTFQDNFQSILQASLKKAADSAGESAQKWFESNAKQTMSKPVFHIPGEENTPFSWDW